MKKIISHFIEKHNHYALDKADMDSVITLANGDARKALNLVYSHYIKRNARKYTVQRPSLLGGGFTSNRPPPDSSGKEEELKYNIYHTLGKFLYAKRLNHEYDPYLKPGKKNELSRYYNE